MQEIEQYHFTKSYVLIFCQEYIWTLHKMEELKKSDSKYSSKKFHNCEK